MADAKVTTIYGLIDPRDGFVRYVGKTTMALSNRIAVHVNAAKKTHTMSARWICGLLSDGLRPEAFVIDSVTSDWEESEQFWIAYFRFIGCRLTNHLEGGYGRTRRPHEMASILRMRAAQQERFKNSANPLKGRKRPPEVVAKMLATKLAKQQAGYVRKKPDTYKTGFTIPQETREKISAAIKGKKKPPRSSEHARKLSEANSGRSRSAEVNRAVSEKLKGRTLTDEHRLRLSIAAKSRYAIRQT
jgi:hypothetical protein